MTTSGIAPGKIIAVHLNYPSRAAQRGRTPAQPSYFLKPSSSLAASGARSNARPAPSCSRSRARSRSSSASPPGGSPPPTAGATWPPSPRRTTSASTTCAPPTRAPTCDRRAATASRRSGPTLIDAASVDPAGPARAHVGERRARAGGHERHPALPVRPAGRRPLAAHDARDRRRHPHRHARRLVGRRARRRRRGRGRRTGCRGRAELGSPGHDRVTRAPCRSATSARARGRRPPAHRGVGRRRGRGARRDRAADAARARAVRAHRRAARAARLRRRRDPQRRSCASAATPTSSSRACTPNRAGARVVGRARTLRFIPFRPDLFARKGGGYNAQKVAFDTVGPGEVLVIDARGERGTGTVGDVLALRAQVRGAAGIVTDGGTRDFDVVAALEIPTFSQGPHPSVLGRRHVPWEVDVAIACGGAAVEPGDVIVGDGDGVIVIPPALAVGGGPRSGRAGGGGRVGRRAGRGGASVDGLFPMNAEWRARYEAEATAPGDDAPTPARDRRGASAESKSQLAYRFIRERIDDGRYVPGLPARARPDRQGARRLGRARARGDPPARGRGARDLRAQRRRAGRAHQGDRVPAHHADARASSRARRPRCPHRS